MRHLLCSDLHGVSLPGSTNAFEKPVQSLLDDVSKQVLASWEKMRGVEHAQIAPKLLVQSFGLVHRLPKRIDHKLPEHQQRREAVNAPPRA